MALPIHLVLPIYQRQHLSTEQGLFLLICSQRRSLIPEYLIVVRQVCPKHFCLDFGHMFRCRKSREGPDRVLQVLHRLPVRKDLGRRGESSTAPLKHVKLLKVVKHKESLVMMRMNGQNWSRFLTETGTK